MSTDLRTALAAAIEGRLDPGAPPAGDLHEVVRVGTRRRRVRRGAVAAGTVTALALGSFTVADRLAGINDSHTVVDYPSLGQLDFDGGVRAYADPGQEVHLGGRTFDASDMEFLDTDAVVTPYGMVFYDDGRPMLLGEDGETRALVEGPVESNGEFHPTAKADSVRPLVAFATLRDGVATITVRDMATGEDTGTLDVECGECGSLVIDGLDDGVVLYRTGDATMYWAGGGSAPVAFAGAKTRVADVRNHVLLHDGPAPTSPVSDRYRMIPAAIDAQLTLDGRYILYWSSRLEPTRSGEDPVVLEQGPTKRFALGFWNIDSDGSVLVAAVDGSYPDFTIYDCEVPSGACAAVGPLSPTGGDPQFIGTDM